MMLDYRSFFVYPDRGFLPERDPLTQLPSEYAAWDQVAADLPKLLVSKQARKVIESLPNLSIDNLSNRAEEERAMMLLSFIGHSYVWAEATPPQHITKSIAVPWHAIAKKVGRPPCLSYASYALHNWRRIDQQGPVAAGNIALLTNFWGGVDEEWFVIIHVDIEAKAAPAITSLFETQKAIIEDKPEELLTYLTTISNACETIYQALCRMPEFCDPYIYYNRVRPFIHGWQDNPVIPNGLIYEGVREYQNKPIVLRGETGAQSSLIPALDAVFGTAHVHGPLSGHLNDMRRYMPPKHLAFIEALEQGPNMREFVVKHLAANKELGVLFNKCVGWIEKFREKHLEYAVSYIESQKETALGNPTKVGTGATPYVEYLRRHKEHTKTLLV